MHLKHMLPSLTIDDTGWTSTVPMEPGTMWWFSGWKSGRKGLHAKSTPELILVEIWGVGSGAERVPLYVSGGGFISVEQMEGAWQRVALPGLPADHVAIARASATEGGAE
jgi:hypothetical protein